jgi:hypothetical protein
VVKKILILLVLIVLTSGCYFFGAGPVINDNFKNVTEKPNEKQLFGNWEIDKFSYRVFKNYKYPARKVTLRLFENGSFLLENCPKFVNILDNGKDKIFSNVNGKWKLAKDFQNRFWVISMDFPKSDIYNLETNIDYELYIKNGKIIIWTAIGDPDSGDRFLFDKP